MKHRRDIDKAIRNIMKWAERPELSDTLEAVFDAHLVPVCKEMGIQPEELGQELPGPDYWSMLFGFIFEDFLSCRLPPDGNYIIDDYLKRRGWRESVPGRRYLQKLRDSVPSLYEIIEVTPGRHCDIRDLVRGGESFRVYEHMGTQNMVKWDRIAARVLHSNGKHFFAGGILPFTREAAQSVLKVLTKSRKTFIKEIKHEAGKNKDSKPWAIGSLDKIFLSEAAPAITTLWLTHILECLRAPLPEIVNRDGESYVFTQTRFPVQPEQVDEIARRLDADPRWERDAPDACTWSWLEETKAGKKQPKIGLTIETLQDGQRLINGMLELASGALTLSTNSKERMERGRKALETLLQGLVGPALSKLQTAEQMMADSDSLDQDEPGRGSAGGIDPAIPAELTHTLLDQHYRQCLDEPIPMLDNKTPRQCTESQKSREQVIDWLKSLENNEQRRAARDGGTPYDTSWLWDELKLRE